MELADPTTSVVIISKNEANLAQTLESLADQVSGPATEVVVVDASDGGLDDLAGLHPQVRWVPFPAKPGKAITIPEQRNRGVHEARGRVIVFIDSGCVPKQNWLTQLVAPLVDDGETVTVGRTLNEGAGALYSPLAGAADGSVSYVDEAPTINLAFRRSAFDDVDGFDETFDYGSDIDFTWRLREAGHRLRLVDSAILTHDWGSPRRQVRRAYLYGRARTRLYHKHLRRVPRAAIKEPVLFAYPLFLLALPLTFFRRMRWLPLLLAIPMWRARKQRPLLTVADHLAYGLGVLSYLATRLRRR